MGLDEGIIYQQKLNRNVKNYSVCPPDLALTAAIIFWTQLCFISLLFE